MVCLLGLGLFLCISCYLDLKYRKISVPLCVCFGIIAIGLQIMNQTNLLFYSLGILPGIFVLLISKLSNGAIGMGDGYIICVIGIFLGVHVVLQIIMGAFLLAAMFSMVLLVFKKMKRGMTVPFVPFIVLSFLAHLKMLLESL